MGCHFCDRSKIEDRLFYEDDNWLAFLAAPFHTSGHTILAAKRKNESACPQGLTEDVLSGFNSALAKVAKALKEKYKVQDVLVASLRGDMKHNHWHLIPLHDNEEKSWRQKSGHGSGHLFEFLGELEKHGDARARQERKEKQWDDEKQRLEITQKLQEEVDVLQNLTGYSTA